MSKSSLLRLEDVRRAYRLIGDCRDMAATPDLWQQRTLDGLAALVGADRATGGEGEWVGPEKELRVLSAHWSGFDRCALEYFFAHIDHLRMNGGDRLLRTLRDLPGPVNTRALHQLVARQEWYRSMEFNEFQRPAGCHHLLTSMSRTSAAAGAILCISLYRGARARDFSGREQQLMHFFCMELRPLIGGPLVSVTDPRPDRLPPRLRQTLHFLLQGDSEKQVAARLGVSRSTTHEYVTALYRRFRVHSRAELMAYAMKRLAQPNWQRLQAKAGDGDGD